MNTYPPTNASYPLRLEGRLDPGLSRGLWIIKWILAIPHYIVLWVLWFVFAILTIIAWFAILFTARYPRSLFLFNEGILRWTWRVYFYAFVLGTDRYPPFKLQSDPNYPADLWIDYPERLSRGLIFVKWWLLAIPHYLVISIFTSGMVYGRWQEWGEWDGHELWWAQWGRPWTVNFGLIGLLVLFAAIALLFRGRYPSSIFDFVMGMWRWIYRVTAYTLLFRDEYPPFRLDQGGADPPVSPRAEPIKEPSG
ncbi:DUF4389 domain-containing protein [Actinopolymorpha alba]|uniref:DUF4389 domain-containing protein n=1 Tax=Actinopolymorpha alba TaxID=533267 RepID=UPI000372C958|nr:DUF4389 domain-containing protein [Actinopolymorpha alba]